MLLNTEKDQAPECPVGFAKLRRCVAVHACPVLIASIENGLAPVTSDPQRRPLRSSRKLTYPKTEILICMKSKLCSRHGGGEGVKNKKRKSKPCFPIAPAGGRFPCSSNSRAAVALRCMGCRTQLPVTGECQEKTPLFTPSGFPVKTPFLVSVRLGLCARAGCPLGSQDPVGSFSPLQDKPAHTSTHAP